MHQYHEDNLPLQEEERPAVPDEQDDSPSRVQFTLGQKTAVFLPMAAVACGADMLLHAPLPIAIGGVIGAFVLARNSPEIYEELSRHLPLPDLSAKKERQPGEWGWTDRLMGRHLEPVEESEPGEEVTLPLPPARRPALPEEPQEVRLNFGPTLQPDANSLMSGRKVLLGTSDAGKSNNVAVMCEEYARMGMPLFLFDTEGEYRQLCQHRYFPRPIHVTSEKIAPEQAYRFAQWALGSMKQVVIDLSTYDDDEAAWMMIHTIQGVRDFEEAQYDNADGVRLPCEIVLDEATVWLPQNANQSTLSKLMVTDPYGKQNRQGNAEKVKPVSLLALLQRSFFSVVVRRGRKRGMGFTLATQRPAELDKSALSVNWIFLMRQTQAADFEVYKTFGISAQQALSLKQGEAFVSAPGQPFERHRFRLRTSPHGASTPGLKELRQHQHRLAGREQQDWNPTPSVTFERDIAQPLPEERPMPETSSPSHIDNVYATIENMRAARFPEEEIAALLGISQQAYLAVLTQAARNLASASSKESAERDLMIALDHWRTLADKGIPCGFRTLNKLTGWSEKKCREILAELARRGYIARGLVESGNANGSPSPEFPDPRDAARSNTTPPPADAIGGLQGVSQPRSQIATDAPGTPPEFTPETFVPRSDDLLLSELQAELLVVYYRNCGNVSKSLEQIRNEKGQGLGGRYTRHASFILEQRGLKKKKA